ncbi:MAG: GNAT family N-acetyltransferase [Alphaproteobacteria bacterium]|nr:GNAT family N-acetyltransferase [Alphaproteobacteria bacterium]
MNDATAKDGDTSSLAVRLVEKIDDIARADWDACAIPDPKTANPFVSYDFLFALEASESVSAEAGWLPRHLVVEDGRGKLLGAAPMYIKGHSQGEYVFDWGWADAFERAGGTYYPKLQVAVPFSPVTGPRLLVRPGATEQMDLRETMITALAKFAERLDVSSVHVTFPTAEEWRLFERDGWIQRLGQQFYWHNDGYENFDDFLGALQSRKRKTIRKERREVNDQGIRVATYSGDDIRPEYWDEFFRFYSSTYDRKWGYPYLTRKFFDILHETMRDKVALVLAHKDGDTIAGAINLIGGDALFGRNWGCDEDFRFLHFEACYYQAIDFAIERGLARVEAGTKGAHKVQRGYLPCPTYSAHYIRHDGLARAIADFCAQERDMVTAEIAAFAGHSPFRQASEN